MRHKPLTDGQIDAWRVDVATTEPHRREIESRKLATIDALRPPADSRPLRLTWSEHERSGSTHTEWHAPCGCAYHPEPVPHIHPCDGHTALAPPHLLTGALEEIVRLKAEVEKLREQNNRLGSRLGAQEERTMRAIDRAHSGRKRRR